MALDAEQARQWFLYQPATGVLYWRPTGRIAGTTDADGYRAVQFERVIYRAHRLIWLLVHGRWPEGEIDHIDGDVSNNRIENLRDVTRAHNAHNQRRAAGHNASSHHIGVSWQPSRKRWLASITVDGKTRYIGRFKTEEEAAAAYWEAKAEYHPTAPLRNPSSSGIVPT